MGRNIGEFNGEKITEARELHELTIKALSEIAQVSRQTLSLYESNKQVPKPDVINRLANALRVKWDFFMQESAPKRTMPTFFRSFSSATLRSRESSMRTLDFIERVVGLLAEFVDFPVIDLPPIRIDSPEKLSDEAIESIALETRKHWGLSHGPIPNLTAFLELKGLIISLGDSESDSIDAFSRWNETDGRPYVRLCANKHCAVRTRFDLAHELGHLILHSKIEKEDFSQRNFFSAFEAQADRFAGAFLLPEMGFSNDLDRIGLEYFSALKPKWKVSIGVMIKRAAQLGFIDKEHERLLWIYRSRKGWNKREPYDDTIPLEEPLLLKEFIVELINEEVLSREAFLAMLPYAADFVDRNLLLDGFLREEIERQDPAQQLREKILNSVTASKDGKVLTLHKDTFVRQVA